MKISVSFVLFLISLLAVAGQIGYGTTITNYTAWQNAYSDTEPYTLALYHFDNVSTITNGHSTPEAASGSFSGCYAQTLDTAATNPSHATFVANGRFGGGFSNIGGSAGTDVVTLNNSKSMYPSGSNPSISVEFWVNLNDVSTTQYFVDKKWTTTNGFTIAKSNDGYLEWMFGNGTTSYTIYSTSALAWQSGTWYHIAATLDGDTHTVSIYRDDTCVKSTTSSSFTLADSTSYNVALGNRLGSSYCPLNGVMDEFRISSVAYQYTPEPATVMLLCLGACLFRKRK